MVLTPEGRGRVADKTDYIALRYLRNIIRTYSDVEPYEFIDAEHWSGLLNRLARVCEEVKSAALKHKVYRVVEAGAPNNPLDAPPPQVYRTRKRRERTESNEASRNKASERGGRRNGTAQNQTTT